MLNGKFRSPHHGPLYFSILGTVIVIAVSVICYVAFHKAPSWTDTRVVVDRLVMFETVVLGDGGNRFTLSFEHSKPLVFDVSDFKKQATVHNSVYELLGERVWVEIHPRGDLYIVPFKSRLPTTQPE